MSKTMVRIIKDKENPYVMLNKKFLSNENLSWQAKGMLSYLLSLPDDWKIYESEISTHSKDGIKCANSCIKELISNGYINRGRLKDEKGRFKGYEYCVYEVSSITPKTENGKTENGKRHTTNNNNTNNNITEYNNDNGVLSDDKNSVCNYTNKEAVKAISLYMNDFYKQRTGKRHPYLKPEQYKNVYSSICSMMDEWGLGYDAITAMMCKFLNTRTIDTDWNINHFATEGIMLNRMYEVAY